VFISAIVQGIVGFGFALIAVPIGLSLLNKTIVLNAILIIGITLNLALIVKNKKNVAFSIIKDLFISSLAGIVVGIFVLKVVSTVILLISAGVLIVLFSMLLFFSNKKGKANRFSNAIAGFISGILNSSTGLCGPPIALLLTHQHVNKDVYKKTLSLFFLYMNCITIFLYGVGSLIDKQGIVLGIYAIPFVVIAAIIGHKISEIVNMKTFKIIALILIFLTGLTSIYKGIDSLYKPNTPTTQKSTK